MNVIFLDIDGVLNYCRTESRAPCGCIGVDNDKIERLRNIVDATGAKIVLCSTWKSEWDSNPDLRTDTGEYLSKKLAKHGVHILDKTEDNITDRGAGINRWLNKCAKKPNWIVIDDEIFPDYKEQGVMPHLVKTSWHFGGLQDIHVQKSIDLLMGASDKHGSC